MADQKLLSRRQILALFGAGTGMAIVGAQGQQTQDVDGNVLGGADNMPAPYKVGESTYKGPLSVRSEVPQEDGITFIQTDAGDANDQFALHHYNGGWGQQGLDVTSLGAEEAQITQTQETRPAADIIDIDQPHGISNSQFPVGSSWSGTPTRLLTSDVTGITSTSWTQIGQDLFYGYVDSPPNTVPIIRVFWDIQSDDSGETLHVGLTTADYGTPPIVEVGTGTGTARTQLVSTFYGSEIGDFQARQGGITDTKLRVVAQVSGGSNGGTVFASTAVSFGYEVI